MGQEQGRARHRAQGQGSSRRSIGQLQRLGQARDFRAGDLAPTQHQGGIG